jgi:uncharacterized protein YjiS (DUF1127 family)
MMTITDRFPAADLSGPSIFGALGRALRRMNERSELRALSRLDDWILDDVGLTRADIDDAIRNHKLLGRGL